MPSKEINFDGLVARSASLLPVSATPMSGFALAKDCPSGQAEKSTEVCAGRLIAKLMTSDIPSFEEFRYTMLKTKTTGAAESPVPSLKQKIFTHFPSVAAELKYVTSKTIFPIRTSWRVQWLLALQEESYSLFDY